MATKEEHAEMAKKVEEFNLKLKEIEDFAIKTKQTVYLQKRGRVLYVQGSDEVQERWVERNVDDFEDEEEAIKAYQANPQDLQDMFRGEYGYFVGENAFWWMPSRNC
jgi:hypothetical protein